MIIACGVLFLDQLTKFVAVRVLSLHESVPVIRGVFHITLVQNTGAAFGLLKNQTPVFIAASLVAIVLIMRDLKNRGGRRFLYRAALSLILGGAAGNFIDRVLRGYVVDFLDFRVWPVFNVADSAITIGVILMGYVMLTEKSRGDKT